MSILELIDRVAVCLWLLIMLILTFGPMFIERDEHH
jgi:hypothetical protein